MLFVFKMAVKIGPGDARPAAYFLYAHGIKAFLVKHLYCALYKGLMSALILSVSFN